MSTHKGKSVPSAASTPLNIDVARVANQTKQTETDSSNSHSLDYLGQPPSREPSESDQSEQNKRDGAKTQRARKQLRPKKIRQDFVSREIRRLQNSTKWVIPKLPFQRYE